VPLKSVCLARATLCTFVINTKAFKEENELEATKKRRKKTSIVSRVEIYRLLTVPACPPFSEGLRGFEYVYGYFVTPCWHCALSLSRLGAKLQHGKRKPTTRTKTSPFIPLIHKSNPL
jgi:hypothetical protein